MELEIRAGGQKAGHRPQSEDKQEAQQSLAVWFSPRKTCVHETTVQQSLILEYKECAVHEVDFVHECKVRQDRIHYFDHLEESIREENA